MRKPKYQIGERVYHITPESETTKETAERIKEMRP